ncbi:PREDICTED: serine/arginine-rich splicing factor 11-like [Branchiostoma belcheri]|uniref:Serine/arginine-rich splicing factor 11-like n=1 Tax=Branchiostoma belcheri TaxID=7741 RepID=A0A6P4XZ43_BRABE|nr:PREDICTED: serine/arginine-rich splicing factor 11-like [Branchiostoma belcheri]
MAQTKVIQVTNVAPAATKEQMQTLFSFLGKIDEIKLYPEDISVPVTSKVCYVKYDDPTNCGVAQHLTNTVFIDRALIVVPCQDGVIPDEAKALQLAAPANAVAGMIPGGGAPAASALLPTPAPIANPLLAAAGVGGEVLGATLADQDILGAFFPESVSKDVLGSGMGDQAWPGVVTVYVGNLDSATVTAEQLLNFFQQVGEVKYVRMAGDETQPTRFAFVEFADQTSVAKALQYNGIMFGNRPLKINHSNNAIVKPQTQTPEAQRREIEEAMKRVRDAEALITAAIEPGAVNYSNIALNKPVALTNPHVAQIDAVLNQVREAQSHISSALNAGTMTAATLLQIPTIEKPTLRSSEVSEKKEDKRRRSRSRSRSYSRRRRSRSRSPRRSRSRRSRSRSRHRRSRSRSPKRRSRSPRRRRSRSRERRSRSRSRRSPSKSPARRHSTTAKGRRRSRSRTPPRSYRTTSRLSRSKSRSPRRRSRSPKRSPSKSPARRPSSSKHKKEKKKDKDKDRDRSGSRERDTTKSKKKKKDKDKDKDRDREKDKEKHRGKSKEQEEDKKEAKVTRDYDEEEQGYDSEKEKVSKPPAPEAAVEQSAEAPPSSDDVGDSGSQGQADMEMDSD